MAARTARHEGRTATGDEEAAVEQGEEGTRKHPHAMPPPTAGPPSRPVPPPPTMPARPRPSPEAGASCWQGIPLLASCGRSAGQALDEVTRSAGQTLGEVGRTARAVLTPRGLRGALVETVWASAHLAIYPLGLVRDRQEPHDRYHLGGLAPVQRGLVIGDVEAAGTPILLVHGMIDNRAIFAVLRRRLRRRGFGRVFTLNYPPTTNDIRTAARDLSAAVEDLVARTGYERIHVVGHSLGGLIARYYVQRLGGDERVHTLVTLGSPHAGTLTASVLPLRLFRQLRPGSDLYTELAGPAPGCRTRFVAYWSPMDQLILPHENARLEHPDLSARNVLVPGVGHMSIPIDGTVVHEISLLLSQLDSDGTVLSAGVTALSDDRSTGGRVSRARRGR
ncbi:MAG TPA: alpha/beta fold hydrolase [Kineosporiaceae bacterium]|nr:alpha/beta fold hydrolase [Kineosporiaceae bacterium]